MLRRCAFSFSPGCQRSSAIPGSSVPRANTLEMSSREGARPRIAYLELGEEGGEGLGWSPRSHGGRRSSGKSWAPSFSHAAASASASDGGGGDRDRGAAAVALETDTPPGGGSSPPALKEPRFFPATDTSFRTPRPTWEQRHALLISRPLVGEFWVLTFYCFQNTRH